MALERTVNGKTLLLMPPAIARAARLLRCPRPGPGAPLLRDSLSSVPLFKEFSPRFLCWEAPSKDFSPYSSAKKVWDGLPLPLSCAAGAQAGQDAA